MEGDGRRYGGCFPPSLGHSLCRALSVLLSQVEGGLAAASLSGSSRKTGVVWAWAAKDIVAADGHTSAAFARAAHRKAFENSSVVLKTRRRVRLANFAFRQHMLTSYATLLFWHFF